MRKLTVSPLRFGLVALACLSFVAACGSDDDSGSNEPAEAAESEEGDSGDHEVVPAAEVTAGYAEMLESMTALSADPVSATDEALDEVHETWESFEGTVKQEDPDAYLASEEALDSFLEAGKDGNAVAMGEATAKMSETAATYLAAHPG
jgi:hypothetical protein